MKNSASQIAKQIVQDHKEFIEGNISEYLIHETLKNDVNLYQYLTEDEIKVINENTDIWMKHDQEVEKMLIDNFDFDISEFEY